MKHADIVVKLLGTDPLTLAIFFVGAMGLAVVWLAVVVVRSSRRH